MGKQNMVCGVDCIPDGQNCNGYCKGNAHLPPAATEQMIKEKALQKAHTALNDAERAWAEYAKLCDVGPGRERAFEIYENVRNARRV